MIVPELRCSGKDNSYLCVRIETDTCLQIPAIETKIIIGQNVEDRELTRYFYIAVPVCLCGERSMVALVSKLSLRFS